MKKIIRIFLVLLVVFSITACSQNNNEAQTENETQQEEVKPYLYYVLPKSGGTTWVKTLNGYENGLEAFAVEGYSAAPTTAFDVSEIVDLMKNAAVQGANVIVTAMVDPTVMTPVVKELQDQGIKVITILSDSKDVDVNVGATPSDIGTTMFEEARDLAGEGADLKILYFGTQAGTAFDAELDDVKALCEKDGHAEIVNVDFVNGDALYASDRLAQNLLAYPEANVVLCHDTSGSVGVGAYIKENALGDKLIAIGGGESPDIVQYTAEGHLDGFVTNSIEDLGYLAVEAGIKLLNGEEVPLYLAPEILKIHIGNIKEFAEKFGYTISE